MPTQLICRMLITSVLLLTVHAEGEYLAVDDGKIMSLKPISEATGSPVICDMQRSGVLLTFTSSEEGHLLFLEKLPEFDQSRISFGGSKAAQFLEDGETYDPELPVARLIIASASCEVLHSVPIPQRAGLVYSNALFYGRAFAGLQLTPRTIGLAAEVFVNYRQGTVWRLHRDGERGEIETFISPDGMRLLNRVGDMVYLDGALIYPYPDDLPYRADRSPEECEQKWEESRQRLAANEWLLPLHATILNPWSPDSKYVVLPVTPRASVSRSAASEARRMHALVIDVAKARDNADLAEYSRVVEMDVSEGAEQGPQKWKPAIQWSEDGNSLRAVWTNKYRTLWDDPNPSRHTAPVKSVLKDLRGR